MGNEGGNTGAFALWGVGQGCNVWRCTATDLANWDSVEAAPDNYNHNVAGVYSYGGIGIHVERCTFSVAEHGVFQKSINTLFDASATVRFCHFDNCYIEYGNTGSGGASHSYTIVQSNLFDMTTRANLGYFHDTENSSSIGADCGWLFGNIFKGCSAALYVRLANELMPINNVMLDCSLVVQEYIDYSAFGVDYKFWDFNHTYNSGGYRHRNQDYTDAADWNSSFPAFAANDVDSDPLFTDSANGDFTTQMGSPLLTNGIDGTDKGLYFTGIEVIGA